MAQLGLICSVYNDTKHIDTLLRTCKNISLKDLKVYFINDYSTVDVDKYLKNVNDFDSRFHYINSESSYLGLGAARNYVLDQITDNYVGFIDSDDFVSPIYHETLLNLARRYDLDCIKTGWTVVNNSVRKSAQLESVIPQNVVLEGSHFFAPYNKSNLYDRPHSWAGIYRKDFLDINKIRFSNLFSAEDRYFWLRCLFFSKRTMAIPLVKGYYYRKEDEEIRLTSIGNKIQNAFFDSSLEIISFCKENVKEDDDEIWKKVITQIIALIDFHFRNRNRLSEIALLDLHFKAGNVIDELTKCPHFEFIYARISKERRNMIDFLRNKEFIYD